jgi:hypothetical protein
MPAAENKGEDLVACTAMTTLIAAFGTVLLLPSLKTNNIDRNLLLWLFYVLAAAMSLGAGRNPVVGLPRFLIASIPGLMTALYIGFRVLVLGDTMHLSGLSSENPRFWTVVATTTLVTWCFVWLFSHTRAGLGGALRKLKPYATEKQINALSRTLTAAVGLLGVIGMLISTLLPA